jgi:outer membrane biosynthesis protein TonB
MEIKSLMEVEIRVHIDDKGRVVKAEPLPAKGRVSDSLVNAARKAALHWRFEPAWVGSRPVASELVLKFQYRPAAP